VSWRYRAQTGSFPETVVLTDWVSLDEAYDAAEQHPEERAAIILKTSEPGSGGLADSREPGAAWVCGRERWRANERAAA
jgi:hypothetical protein